MNTRQKVIVVTGVLVMAAMAIVPPHYSSRTGGYYGFIGGAEPIAMSVLLTQWSIVAMFGGLAMYLAPKLSSRALRRLGIAAAVALVCILACVAFQVSGLSTQLWWWRHTLSSDQVAKLYCKAEAPESPSPKQARMAPTFDDMWAEAPESPSSKQAHLPAGFVLDEPRGIWSDYSVYVRNDSTSDVRMVRLRFWYSPMQQVYKDQFYLPVARGESRMLRIDHWQFSDCPYRQGMSVSAVAAWR